MGFMDDALDKAKDLAADNADKLDDSGAQAAKDQLGNLGNN